MEIDHLIKACKKGDKDGQYLLYKHFYGYAMGICLLYAHSQEEAQEIANDGFLKIFKHIKDFRRDANFKTWLRRIMINTAIDYFRMHQKHYYGMEITHVNTPLIMPESIDELSKEEILKLVQQLPPAYRTVFNLYVIEGYKHHEIADKLGINIGTSKSNLAKARIRLRKLLNLLDKEIFENYGRKAT